MSKSEDLSDTPGKYIPAGDEKSLRMVQDILAIEQDENWWDTLPPQVQQSLERAIKESEIGECIPREEVMKMYQQWLKN